MKRLIVLLTLFSVNLIFPETKNNFEDVNYLIKNVKASSYLSPYSDYSFVPENVLDSDLATCWQVQYQSNVKPWIEIYLKEPIKLYNINIANGFQHYDKHFGDLYFLNSRIKKATVIINDEYKNPILLNFKDIKGFDSFNTEQKNVKKIKMIIDEVNNGSKWKDISVSDIVLWGENKDKIEGDNQSYNLKAFLDENILYIKSGDSKTIYYKEKISIPEGYEILFKDLKLTQNYEDKYLVVSIGGIDVTIFVFGLFDCQNKKWAFRFDNEDNTSIMMMSYDKRYIFLDTGTSAGGRGLNAFDLKTGHHVLNSGYQTIVDPYWNGDKLIYYRYAGKKVEGLPELPADDNKIYIQKTYFEKGIEIRTEEYTNSIEEE